MGIIPRRNPDAITPLADIPGVKNEARVSFAGAEAVDAGTRAAVQGLGAFAQVAQQAQDRKDSATFLDAQTKLSEFRRTWADPNNPKGQHSYQGKNALEAPNAGLREFDSQADTLTRSLSPRAQTQFKRVVANERDSFAGSLTSYANSQLDGFEEATRRSYTIETTDALSAAILAGDEKRAAQLRQQAGESIAADGLLRGRPDGETRLRIRGIVSDAHVQVLGRLMPTDPQGAGRYLEAHGEEIDPDRRSSLEAQITGRVETANAKRETVAERAVNFVHDAAATGIPLTGEALLAKSREVEGTSQQEAFLQAVGRMHEVETMRRQPLAAQEAYIAQVEQEIQRGSDDPKRDQARLTTLRTALTNSRKLAAESPILFYQNQGGDPVEPLKLQTLGTSSGPLVEAQLAERFNVLGAMRKKYGPEVALNPWRPEEAHALDALLSRPDATPASKLAVLDAIDRAAPDLESFRAALAPVSLSNRVYVIAAQEQALKHKADKGGDLAPIILQGNQVLADKSFILPTEAKFRAAFDSAVGDAYPPGTQARSDAYIRFKTLYAGLIHTVPRSEAKGMEAELDDTLADTVTDLATGGMVDYNGRRTVVPFGWEERKFTDTLQTVLADVAKETGFNVDRLGAMPLLAIPNHEGRYLLLNQGRPQVNPKTGAPVIVSLP